MSQQRVRHWVVDKYNDATITWEWDDIYDGKWPFETEEHIRVHDKNFYPTEE